MNQSRRAFLRRSIATLRVPIRDDAPPDYDFATDKVTSSLHLLLLWQGGIDRRHLQRCDVHVSIIGCQTAIALTALDADGNRTRRTEGALQRGEYCRICSAARLGAQ